MGLSNELESLEAGLFILNTVGNRVSKDKAFHLVNT
jgi:hypothetical protein